jgi:peptide deformylase
MAILKIQIGADNPILRAKSKKVLKVAADIKKLIKNMNDTFHFDVVGLAAPQVGVNLRLVLIKLNPDTKNPSIICMISPEILSFSKNIEVMEEGCLSLPKIYGNVKRSKSIIVSYQDIYLRNITLNLKGINARIVQHEVDHIDGILFIDRIKI